MLLGWLCADLAGRPDLTDRPGPWGTQAGTSQGSVQDAHGRPRVPRECVLDLDPLPPRLPSLADLRRIRGVGDTRARSVLRHLWLEGAGADFGRVEVDWEQIEGIGPITAGALEGAFPSPGSEAHPEAHPTPEAGAERRVPP